MNHIRTIVFVCLLMMVQQAFAQQFAKVEDWLDDNASKMGGRAILMVYKDGKVVYSYAANEQSRKQKMMGKLMARKQGKKFDGSDYTPDTKIAIASCSKWLSAALVMTFVDEGKLRLTDTVGTFLPVMSAHGKGNITITQCLSHTTAIKAPGLKESLQEMRQMNSMDDAINAIANMPMEGAPGKVFRYSNTGLQLAGAVIEKISGKSFETLFAERIAHPLNMRNSDFGHGKVALPAGGAYSTPNDYTNFLSMILNKGMFNGKRILSEESIRQMLINRVTKEVTTAYSPAEAKDAGYGFGEWVWETASATNLTTSVTSPGLFGSFPWVDFPRNYCAFMMCFYIKPDGRHERYRALKALVDEALAK